MNSENIYVTPDGIVKSIYADPEYRRPEMKTYVSLRDLPGAPKGTEWVKYGTRPLYETKNREGAFGGTLNLNFNEEFILANPDWWAEKKEETLESAVEKFFEECKYLGIGVKSTEEGDRFCQQFNQLRDVYNRLKGERK